VYLYVLSKKDLRLLFQDERYKKYSTVGVFEGMKGWVCLGDFTGRAKIFHIENHPEVSDFSTTLIPSPLNLTPRKV
jgi:hypothetical protein